MHYFLMLAHIEGTDVTFDQLAVVSLESIQYAAYDTQCFIALAFKLWLEIILLSYCFGYATSFINRRFSRISCFIFVEYVSFENCTHLGVRIWYASNTFAHALNVVKPDLGKIEMPPSYYLHSDMLWMDVLVFEIEKFDLNIRHRPLNSCKS